MIQRRALSGDELFHLRRVAIHEAGHAQIAAIYGVTGEIRIFPVLERSSQFQFSGIFLPDSVLPDSEANRQYGLAGVAAEGIDGGFENVVHILAAKTMSPPDIKLAGEFEPRHVMETIGLLKWHWGEIEVRATAAMEPWLRGPMNLSNDAASPTNESLAQGHSATPQHKDSP